MTRGLSRFGSALAVAAALSMTATPAMARGWGDWGGGWGGRYHRDRIDAGDVIAGVVILGTIAAIASAASKSKNARNDRDYRTDRDYRDYRTDRGYDSRAGDTRQGGSSAIGNAIDTCAAEIERGDRRIGSVDAVNREGEGWRIQGRAGSAPFDCSVSDTGRIRSVTVDGRAY